MRYRLLWLCLLPGLCWADDEWLGSDAKHNDITLRIGSDSEDQRLYAADLVLELPGYHLFEASYSESEFDLAQQSEHSERTYLRFSTDPLKTWGFGLDYTTTKSDSSVETEDVGVNLRYFPGSWSAELGVSIGTVTSEGVLRRFQRLPSRSREFDRTGYQLRFVRYWNNFSASIDGIVYDYDEEFPENLAQRQFVLLVAQQNLSGLFDLVDWQVSAGAQYVLGDWGLFSQVSQYQFAIVEEQETSITLGADYALSDAWTMGALGSSSIDESIVYGELSLRYQW